MSFMQSSTICVWQNLLNVKKTCSFSESDNFPSLMFLLQNEHFKPPISPWLIFPIFPKQYARLNLMKDRFLCDWKLICEEQVDIQKVVEFEFQSDSNQTQ